MYLARLDNDVIFKKAFSDKRVLPQFVKDILGIDFKVKKIETDKRFSPKIAYINFAYDVFAESKDDRIIVEIQRAKYDYNLDRFLHYHIMAIAELQRGAKHYEIRKRVYTIVVLTAPGVLKDKDDKPLSEDVLISDFDPKTLDGRVFNCYGHKLIFLNPHFKNKNTPPSYVDWFDLITESIHHPDNPSINFKNKAIKTVAELIEYDNLTPEEREAAKIAASTEKNLQLYEEKGKEEGLKEGRREANLETARKMKAKGLDIEMIVEVTGLDAETLKEKSDFLKKSDL